MHLNASNLVRRVWICIRMLRIWFEWLEFAFEVVLNGGAPTPAGTSMLTMWNNCTHMKCEVRNMGMGHLCLIMGGYLGCGYGLYGWGSYDKVSSCLEKCWSSREYPFRSHDHRFRSLRIPFKSFEFGFECFEFIFERPPIGSNLD